MTGRPVAAAILILSALAAGAGGPRVTAAQTRLPNFVFIFLDDSGYGDTSIYGGQEWTTPHIDALAREGVRFVNFHVPQAICSASRAALLTGSYPNRVGINGALPSTSRVGISDSERLLPKCSRRGATPRRFSASGIWAPRPSSCRRGTASTSTPASRSPMT